MASVVIKCVKCLREACESALKEKHFLDYSQMEGFVDDATTSHSEQLEALERVFNTAAEADTPTEVCIWLFFFNSIFIKSFLVVPGRLPSY